MVDQERRDLLAKFGIDGGMASKKVGSFSGGERNRVALAFLAAQDVNFLILDEPTNHLDLWTRQSLEAALKKFSGSLGRSDQIKLTGGRKMKPSLPLIAFVLAVLTFGLQATAQTDRSQFEMSDTGKFVEVKIDGKLFTKYDYSSYQKPIFYPFYGPGQIPMTRNFPMKKVAGEANDHPHHKSLWVGHEINGVDFWAEKGGEVRLRSLKVDHANARFEASHSWIETSSRKTIVKDKIQVSFGGTKNSRYIDYQMEFTAGAESVEFEDTKEGFFAMRVHPSLRHTADPNRGVEKVTGSMRNSAGQSGKEIWGKKAKWVCYSGIIDGKKCAVAMFDHPDNLRHPTTWHARDYGLLAANPFGLRHFSKDKQLSGAHVLSQGKKIAFRYRVLLHSGDFKDEDIEQQFEQFAID